VMGVTGSGKSTFIKHATGSEKVGIGHKLYSCTYKISSDANGHR
jgi:predicted kinase